MVSLLHEMGSVFIVFAYCFDLKIFVFLKGFGCNFFVFLVFIISIKWFYLCYLI
jgi:hypothetical protein